VNGSGDGWLRFGDYEFDSQSGKLLRRGRPVKIQPQPARVLQVLLEHPSELVSRECLRERIWGDSTFVEFDQGLNYCVRQVRLALHDEASRPVYIETLPKQGYRFIAPVVMAPKVTEPANPIAPEPALPSQTADPVPAQAARSAPLIVAVICGVVIAAFAGIALYRTSSKLAPHGAIKRLAVLPLKNLSGDPAQEYLADGMTEEIIGRLAGIHNLSTISRTSVTRFKDTKLPASEIANMLQVDALLEGSVLRQGDRIRVHAQLIRGAADEHLWSETYDREIGDVLSLESDVAESIADKVEVTVTRQEHSRLTAARHVSPDVYESYLRGRVGPHNTRAELEQSITHFKEAIEKEPTFAPAYIGLANAYESLSLILVGAPPDQMRPQVLLAARKALELDPQLAEAHVLMAAVYQKRWQWRDAEDECHKALQLKPSDAAAHLGYASWLLCQGRIEEALAFARRARELDPLGTAGINIGWILFHARRYDEAIQELRSVLAIHPDSASARWYLGFALIGKGQPQAAILELQRTAALMNRSPGSVELLATAEAYAGHRAEALRLIEEMQRDRRKGYFPAGSFINPYLALHDYNEAFLWFERAYAEQSSILQFLKVHPFFDPVRPDPRFQSLIRRVGLK
jgi:TolB-like protein/DNA-binding winged helix-turn-helix (wHTH) protein/tetratricopeptide (TPR) repeat protein